MRISDLIKNLETVLYDYGNLPISINGQNPLESVVLYDSKSAPDSALDFDNQPVELSLEDM